MMEDQAIAAAIDFATKHGSEVRMYDVSAEVVHGNWNIYFYRKEDSGKSRPGDFFTVVIKDGEFSLIPGK